MLLDDGEAERRALAVGDTLHFQLLNGSTRTLAVQGIYTEQDIAGPLVVSHAVNAIATD